MHLFYGPWGDPSMGKPRVKVESLPSVRSWEQGRSAFAHAGTRFPEIAIRAWESGSNSGVGKWGFALAPIFLCTVFQKCIFRVPICPCSDPEGGPEGGVFYVGKCPCCGQISAGALRPVLPIPAHPPAKLGKPVSRA